jgi:two-component system chemotaxis sensor kinase CheA
MDVAGEDTELDRTIVEALSDPLVHMVRNSIDHVLEPPDQRVAAGKSPTGRVLLRAYHQAGQILVEVSDDGRGLNRDKILARARERGLAAQEARLSEADIFNFIFHPGFSTAEKVTGLSGRGVGMDVVRKQIQKLRGRIDIQSSPGKGTKFFLKLPLTLAIIDGLVVGVGRERFIVPLFAVREMFRPDREMLSTVHGRDDMALVRGHLLPVLRLARRLGVTPRSEDPCQGVFIVTENEGRSFCLLVDEFLGKQEVVIKSLGDTFKQSNAVAGAAILGDGRVGLILDVSTLVKLKEEPLAKAA